jgi:parallel beta-helix repeat protein
MAAGVTVVAAVLLVAGTPARAQGSSRYVSPTGTDSGLCSYTAHPCRTVQYAVDRAVAGDTIKVAAGVYADLNNQGGLAQVVYIDKSVTIRGGYAATGFVDPPDPETNPTTLDAQEQGRVLYITGESDVTIEGLRITGGDADGLDGPPYYGSAGGGIYAITATVTIQSTQIFSNTAGSGGGLALAYNNATLKENAITSNFGLAQGGGLFLLGSNLAFESNQVIDNRSNRAGGFYLRDSVATLNENIITENSGGSGGGGALALWGQSEATLTGNIVSDNSAGDGGGLYLREGSSATLLQNTIYDNSAVRGGGLHVSKSSITLRANDVIGNVSYGGGGGLYIWEKSVATISETTIGDNTTKGSGGGLFLEDSNVVLENNMIHGNTASGTGGGLYSDWFGGSVTINRNAIQWDWRRAVLRLVWWKCYNKQKCHPREHGEFWRRTRVEWGTTGPDQQCYCR